MIGKEKEIRFIDLFGGVGGFRLGLERATGRIGSHPKQGPRDKKGRGEPCPEGSGRRKLQEFRCVWYCDTDKWAVGVYNHQFGEEWKPTDARRVRTQDIPPFELLCAGFPCQSFSIAGQREGFKDTRGTLFFEIARILRDRRPALCLLENVGGLLTHDEGLAFQIILESLDELGYDAEWEVLNSKNYGVPQSRSRPFIVGHLRGGSGPEVFPVGQGYGVPDGIQQEAEERGERMENEIACTLRQGSKWSDSLVASSLDYNYWKSHGGNRTMIVDDIRDISNVRIRRFTPRECERLQGFPDDWTRWARINGKKVEPSDTQRYKMMGNAVTVNAVEAVGRRLR